MKKINENWIDPKDKLTWNTVNKEHTEKLINANVKKRNAEIILDSLSNELKESQEEPLQKIVKEAVDEIFRLTDLILNYQG